MSGIFLDASESITQVTIDPQDCEIRIKDAVSRVFGAKRYHSVGVLTVNWDWDGVDLEDVDLDSIYLDFTLTYTDHCGRFGAVRNLLPKAKELSGCVLRDIYGYETKEVRLRAERESTAYTLERRNELARCHLRNEVKDFKERYLDENDLMIFYYRGTSMTELPDETALYLTSGEYMDLVQENTNPLPQHPVQTSIPFQETVMKELNNTRADVLFLLDCRASSKVVKKHNHSLLANSAADTGPIFSSAGFTQVLIDILTDASKNKQWLTLGQLHGQFMKTISNVIETGSPGTCIYPVWHPADEKTDKDGSVLLMPVSGGDEAPIVISNKERIIENIRSMQRRRQGDTVDLKIHLQDATQTQVNNITTWLRRVPIEGEDGFIYVNVGLGRVRCTTAGLKCLQLEVDVMLWHEMAEHEAFVCVDGPHRLSQLDHWSINAPLVEVSASGHFVHNEKGQPVLQGILHPPSESSRNDDASEGSCIGPCRELHAESYIPELI